MKVLILEDTAEKRNAIRNVLENCDSGIRLEIEEVDNCLSALRSLTETMFDLLILDLVVPHRVNESPTAKAGKIVLDEILDGQVKIPTHIICVTAFEEESQILREALISKLVHLVLYKPEDPTWIVGLRKKVELIERRLSQSAGDYSKSSADVVIITSSSMSELPAVLELPGSFVAEYNRQDELHYYNATWKIEDNRTIGVIACAAPSMGMTAACLTSIKAINRWHPRFVVMTGIAASTLPTQNLGDILCVEAAYDYGSGKIIEDESGSRTFQPSPQQLPLDPRVHEILKYWERDQNWSAEIVKYWPGGVDQIPKLVVGVMASGAAVVQSSAMVEQIKSQSRKTVGIDMECYGIFHACALAGEKRPIPIVAKSISDYADKSKTDDAHKYAAFTSARFAYLLLTRSVDLWR